ncbi:ABC transporter substrate-binding protein [Streptomyces gobiensis]|uniref:ABC transporter substrate-binding protein n=1 Tax=Streptomyces gobiensis TaxID=2875706 RepID=UPI001E4DD7BB|nr:ABC transporter substrate-binding protein [Streptomyces gobiensis]UGY94127.1 ABC transporter substrate-binding protein [Streptomyces gobiensis]
MELSRRDLLWHTGRLGLAAGVGLGALPALTACGGTGSGSTPGDAEQAKLGWIQPKTGPLAAAYIPAYAGARLALKEINKAGGLLGEPVKLLEEDDEGSPGTQPTVAQRLLRRGPQMVLGPTGSSQAVASAAALKRGSVLQSAWGGADTLGDGTRFPYHYQLVFNTRLQATAAARYLYEVREVRKIGLLIENSEFGESIRKAFVNMLKDTYQAKPVSIQVFSPDAPDLTPFIKKLDRSGAEAVGLFSGQPQTTALSLQAMANTGFAPMIVSHDLNYVEAYDPIPKKLLERFYGTTYASLSYPRGGAPTTGPAVEYAKKILAEPTTGELPFTAAVAPYYDFLTLLAEIVTEQGTLDPAQLKTAFDQVKGYQGARSKLSFTPEDHNGIGAEGIAIGTLLSAKDKASMGGIFRELAPGSQA